MIELKAENEFKLTKEELLEDETTIIIAEIEKEL